MAQQISTAITEQSQLYWEQREQITKKKLFQLAIGFGLVKEGWTLENYLVDAAEHGGYETVSMWGVQGAGKSSRMLRIGFWLYRDWDRVLQAVEFKANGFVKRLKALDKDKRIPCLLWDDIGVDYPSSKFKTDIKQYEAIDSVWAAIRTKCSVIVTTNPLIDRLAKNIRDNVTFEIFVGRNQMEMVNRVFHLPGIGKLESNFFKIGVGKPKIFNMLEDVPKDVFKQYWEQRIQLTQEALNTLDQVTDSGDIEGYMNLIDASNILHQSPNTLQQMISRGIMQGRKINGILCISNETVEVLRNSPVARHPKKAKATD